ncbi:hypothetical protein EW146_g5662 [Bondarzewia mesenterica]|uniref:Chromatin assembly factor 1 subunit A dimerization domain-containing protein n=1 Tax=Bondarzewia mesenterica TaxID=1095465 RepID=A0A4S4LSQ2_9AGAM|nr:hypothetical protein EW146_g5662 [Bondarzewia mesenterica]
MMNNTPTVSSGSNGKVGKQSMVEIKNGKIVFRQKPMSFEKMTETMQELVKFRELLEERIEKQEPALTCVPEEHRPLIAKFVQESDRSISALCKYIQRELVPTADDDDMEATRSTTSPLPLEAIEATVNSIATRINYGVDVINSVKIPAYTCVWRWEVRADFYDWLPKASREKIEGRIVERVQAKKELQALFDALPQSEKDALLGSKGTNIAAKHKPKALFGATSNDAASIRGSSPPNSQERDQGDKIDAEGVENSSSQRKAAPGRSSKNVDAEKAAREKERQERKAARADKEKKERESQSKSRSLMASFFAKPKASTSMAASTSREPAAGPSSKDPSDFEKVFKPFVLKKDAELAPINWFQGLKKRKRHQASDVIVIDYEGVRQGGDDDVQMSDAKVDATRLSPKSHLKSTISSLPSPLDASRALKRSTSYFKTYYPDPVRSILTRLNEAELSDDAAAVRTLLSELRDRERIPAKVLIFQEDARPGYFGTFTRRSRVIGPRAPFARDVVAVDYSYDSGEEWNGEEEGGGDDLAEVSDEDKDVDEGSSDLEGWLVDEDEEEVATPIDEREDMDAFPFPPLPEQTKGKRKSEEKEREKFSDGAKAKKRKVVVPLVPFVKGPCWEDAIGKCEYDPFKQYKIQLFNDTPYPIDPFTFVSTPFEVAKQAIKPVPSTSSFLSLASASTFVVPALPPHLANPNSIASLPSSAVTSSAAKRAQLPPKNPFPDNCLPFLLTKIATLETSSLPALVDSVYQDLRIYKVKKYAIEIKVREICEKDQRKVWVVKKGIHALNGLTVPS